MLIDSEILNIYETTYIFLHAYIRVSVIFQTNLIKKNISKRSNKSLFYTDWRKISRSLKGTPKTIRKSIADYPHRPRVTAHPNRRQWQFNKAQRPIPANVARYKPIGLTLHLSLSNTPLPTYTCLAPTNGQRILDSIAIDFFIWISFCFEFR